MQRPDEAIEWLRHEADLLINNCLSEHGIRHGERMRLILDYLDWLESDKISRDCPPDWMLWNNKGE